MEKVAFALDVEDEWPPVAVEHVWCENLGSTYRLKNAPFFIKGLAVNDMFSGQADPVNGCMFEFITLESSGHSLVWLIEPDGLDFSQHEHRLRELGCNIECFAAYELHAIDVPRDADRTAVNALVDSLQDMGFEMAFPVWRHS